MIAREKAEAERRRTLERFKEHQAAVDRERHARETALAAKRSRFSTLNVSEALAAARRLTFVDLEAEGARDAAPLNRPTLAMLELFLKVLRERNSVATLQWPRGSRDMSILHPLAMLAMIGSSPERATGGFKWCPAVADFRTLYYPWRGSGTGTTQRRILVDRNEIMKRNGLHLTRGQVGEAELSPELGKLHLTLGHLHHLKVRDANKPHLAHPTLGELYPTFGALGGDNAPRPFAVRALRTVWSRAPWGGARPASGPSRRDLPACDRALCLLRDLSAIKREERAATSRRLRRAVRPTPAFSTSVRRGYARLGPGLGRCRRRISQAANRASSRNAGVCGDPGCLCAPARCASVGESRSDRARCPRAGTPPSRIIVRSSEDCFAADPDIGEVSEVGFQFHSAAGQGAAALRALSEAARASSDPSTAGNLRHAMGNVRRAMSLPCGLAAAHEVLGETDAGAEAFLERRSAGTVLAVIKGQIELCADAAERQRLTDAETRGQCGVR